MAKDVLGKEFKVGQNVARAVAFAKLSAYVEVQVVTSIKDGCVYLNNSKQPMKFPERLAIIS
jgi:hypothetical protein